MRGGWLIGLVASGLALAASVVTLFDPSTSALFPPCVFHAWTGLHCPGCGTLRAFHALSHGDWRSAVAFNPLTTLAVPFLLFGVVRETIRVATGKDVIVFRAPAWSIWMLFLVIVAFGVLRNLPGLDVLAPH